MPAAKSSISPCRKTTQWSASTYGTKAAPSILREVAAGEMITIIENRRETSLLLASQIPATFDGRLRVNVANALAAVTAALADDVQLEYIRQAMRTFTSSFYQTPGRFNLLEFQGRRIIMDYCHNIGGLESMADFVKRMEPARAIAVISMPGDRLDDDIAAFGRLSGADVRRTGRFVKTRIPAGVLQVRSPPASKRRPWMPGWPKRRSPSCSKKSTR